LQAATAPLTGNYAQMAPSEFLGPTISDIAFPLLTGRDITTGRQLGRGEALINLGRNIPAVGLAAPPAPRPSGIIQRTPWQTRARFFGGSITPQTFSRPALQKKALEEVKATWSPTKRAQFQTDQEQQSFVDSLRKAKVPAFRGGKLVPQLQRVWDLRKARKAATADIPSSPAGATTEQSADYQRKAFAAETDLAVKLKLVKPNEAKGMK